MHNDIRVYDYIEDGSLVSRMEQAKNYLDEKFANVHADVDLTDVRRDIHHATHHIIDEVEDNRSYMHHHLVSKDDLHKTRCSIFKKIEDSEKDVKEYIDEKFVDLNEQIKN